MNNPYEIIEFMESHDLVPTVGTTEIQISELRIPVPQTDDLYYITVRNGLIVGEYKKHEVIWKHR